MALQVLRMCNRLKSASPVIQRLSSGTTPPVPSYASVSSSKNLETSDVNDGRQDRLFAQIDIELRAHQPDVLKSYTWFAISAAKELNVKVIESWAEPEPHKVRKTLLRSAHVYSKKRVQYEFRYSII
jgi:ribosomal protein S10